MHFTDAADGEMASPNRVYVFPPGMEMTVADDVFSLRPRSKRRRLRIRRTCRCPGLIQGLSTTYSNQTPSRRVSNRFDELTSLDRFGYAVNALARLFHISPRRSYGVASRRAQSPRMVAQLLAEFDRHSVSCAP